MAEKMVENLVGKTDGASAVRKAVRKASVMAACSVEQRADCWAHELEVLTASMKAAHLAAS